MLGKCLLLISLIDAHFEVVSGAFNLVFQLQQLLKRVVKVDDLGCCLVGEGFADLLEALWSFQELNDEGLYVGDGPDVLALVLHLVVEGILDELKARLNLNLNRPIRVLVVPRLRDACVAGLGSDYIVWNLSRQGA